MSDDLKRAKCPRCHSPLSRCICTFTPNNLTSPLPFIILRHHQEKNHYLNTAKILALSIENCHIFDGEVFNESIFNSFPNIKNWALLFPTENALTFSMQTTSKTPSIEGLIIIDGSWKKAKKIFYLNPFLQTLPSLKLEKNYQSIYELRRCHRENFLSTLEAYAYFLTEQNAENKLLSDELIGRMAQMISKQKGLYSLKE